MKKSLLIGIIVAVVVLGAVFLLFAERSSSTDDISYYKALSEQNGADTSLKLWGQTFDVPDDVALPRLDELQPYQSCRFDHTVLSYALFTSHSYCLVVQYDQQTYSDKKAWLTGAYPSLSGGIPGYNSALPAEFELDGFSFRAIHDEDADYPKTMLFIGTCDEGQQIAVVYCYDPDLDFVAPSAAYYLAEQTGWKNLLK